MSINQSELLLQINVDLEYLGYSYADNNIYGYGTTYILSFNSYSAQTIDIFSDNGLTKCDNRISSSFINKTFEDKWIYSGTPYIDGHIGSNDYLAYPPPGKYNYIKLFDSTIFLKLCQMTYYKNKNQITK